MLLCADGRLVYFACKLPCVCCHFKWLMFTFCQRPSISSLVKGVPDSFTDNFESYEDAVELYTLAFSLGYVFRMVEVGGIHDQSTAPPIPPPCRRFSGSSSIWGGVSDIDDLAAQWSG
jgi:hypothetical protein